MEVQQHAVGEFVYGNLGAVVCVWGYVPCAELEAAVIHVVDVEVANRCMCRDASEEVVLVSVRQREINEAWPADSVQVDQV